MASPGTDDLVAWWALDEASGNRADSHGSNTLTDVNTVTNNTAKVGANAGQFTATNSEALTITDNAALSTGDIDFTLGAWVYLDSGPSFWTIMAKANSDGNANASEFILRFRGDATQRFLFAVSDGSSFTTNTDDNLGAPVGSTWYFVLAWHDATANTINLQTNDGTVDSAAYSNGGFDAASGFALGRLGDNEGQYADGRIDEAFMFKSVLTASERTWLYNSGNGRSYADLTAVSGNPWYYRAQQQAAQ